MERPSCGACTTAGTARPSRTRVAVTAQRGSPSGYWTAPSVGSQIHHSPGVFAVAGPSNLPATVFCPGHGGRYRFTTGPLGVTRAGTAVVGRAVKRAGVLLSAPGGRPGPA